MYYIIYYIVLYYNILLKVICNIWFSDDGDDATGDCVDDDDDPQC